MWEEIYKRFGSISSIEKCVVEYNVWDIKYAPAAKYKIKIYVDDKGMFKGYTNLKVRDVNGEYKKIHSKGTSVDEAIKNTLEQLYIEVEGINIIEEPDRVDYIGDINY